MQQEAKKYPHTSPFTLQMGMWLLMLTVSLLFGAFTYAFMWLPPIEGFALRVPTPFYVSTLTLLASSFLLHRGWFNNKDSELKNGFYYSLIFGIVFLCIQGYAWYELFLQQGSVEALAEEEQRRGFLLPFQYLYLLSGMHALHLIGGLGFLIYVYAKWEEKKERYAEVAVYFWHFLGILWIFLLGVLLLKL
ncbi:MAG: hypothetical protein AAF694_17320 [Bacteroidota bacterium]